MDDPRTVGLLVAFLGTFTVAALMFLLYVTALCFLLALAGTGQLLTWVYRASKPAHDAGKAERPLAVTQQGRHYRSAGAGSSRIR
jgi:hypothetical protein